MSKEATGPRRAPIRLYEAGVLAVVTVVPLFAGGRGLINADTKQYLYLDPFDLLERSRTVWDSRVGGGAVTHQAVGYLWPMGPYYALMDALGLPDWAAQRLWVGGLQLAAALGALALFRHLLPRSWVHVPAAALYGLSPFVLGHITSQSGLLVPFAGLGWLVLCMARAVEEPRSWRWPAAFALVVTTCGSLNGSSVFFVVLAATLWVPVALAGGGAPARGDGARVLLRAGSLTLVTQVWWLVAYAVGGAYNLPILETTETVRTTNATTSAPELLRGLGYWFFYGGDTEGPWLRDLTTPYLTSGLLLMVSFAVPLLALAAGSVLRWRHRAYFTLLIGLGACLAVGAYPIGDSSPAGAAFERLSRTSDLVLSLRNTQRAAALVALGLAGLVAAALTALHRRQPRAATAGAVLVAVLVAGAMPAQWRSGLVAERFHRHEDLPAAWLTVGDALDDGEGRVLELPGSDFATYRWGETLDPVSIGLTDRPMIARELVPLGGDAGADLLEALDRGIQEGWFEPGALAPVARLLGASQVLVRNDLAYERYRTVRPRVGWPLLSSDGTGLGEAVTFGEGYQNVAGPTRPMIDEIELGLEPGPDPPQLALLDVPDGGREPLSTERVGAGMVVDGDGEGVVAAAAAGLLDADGALLLGADVVRAGDAADVSDARTLVVLTDTNRKRAKRWYSLRENAGATEPVDHAVVTDDPSDARLEVAGTTPAGTQTVVEWRGIERVWADAYGGANSLVPEERPSNALDGDPTTAWRSELGVDGSRRRWGVELSAPSDADHVTLVAPQDRLGTVTVTRVRITLDGDRRIDVDVPADATGPAGTEITLDGEPFTRLEVEILATSPYAGLGGFAEVEIPGVEMQEVVVLPTALASDLGPALRSQPLAIVLTRLRANPAEPLRADPEPAMGRSIELPVALDLGITGTARLDTTAPDPVLDELLGAGEDTWGVVATSTARLAGDLDARASSTLDGDLGTAWQTPFSTVQGQAVELVLAEPVTLSELELDVVADGRHSLPASIRLTADDGEPVELDVPAITSPAADGSGIAHVRVRLPRSTTASTWRVEIAGVDIRSTTDWSTLLPFTLPVGIAEIGLPGAPLRPAEAEVDTGCRSDLLEVAGEAVPLRVTGDARDLSTAGGLDVVACAARASLSQGTTELRTTPGRRSGIALDRLVLRSQDTPTSAPPTSPPGVTTRSHRPGHVTGTVEGDGEPFWLVLDESMNEGWELTVDGATVEGPRPLDAYAAGWLVIPERAGSLAVTARWTPQRAVDLALLVSFLGVLGCLALVAWPRRRRPTAVGPSGILDLALPDQPPPWPAVLIAAALAALIVDPLAAPVAAAVVLVARRWPAAGVALPVLATAGSAAAVTVLQVGHEYPASFVWPTRFEWVHEVALLSVLVLTTLVLTTSGSERRR
jgi:hypothetical protein